MPVSRVMMLVLVVTETVMKKPVKVSVFRSEEGGYCHVTKFHVTACTVGLNVLANKHYHHNAYAKIFCDARLPQNAN